MVDHGVTTFVRTLLNSFDGVEDVDESTGEMPSAVPPETSGAPGTLLSGYGRSAIFEYNTERYLLNLFQDDYGASWTSPQPLYGTIDVIHLIFFLALKFLSNRHKLD